MDPEIKTEQSLKKKSLPWWAWVLIVVFGLATISTAFGGAEDSANETRQPAASQVEELSEPEEAIASDQADASPDETLGEKNARRSAESYVSFSSFSQSGLINQLLYEGYSQEEAEYAVTVLKVDWSEQASKSAESYLRFSAFSRSGLIDQLIYEGFSPAEAEYGVQTVGADWNEQAARSAESYLRFSSFSRSGLINQLLYEGFSQSEAEYGVTQNGY